MGFLFTPAIAEPGTSAYTFDVREAGGFWFRYFQSLAAARDRDAGWYTKGDALP
jgi:hypothetical protein